MEEHTQIYTLWGCSLVLKVCRISENLQQNSSTRGQWLGGSSAPQISLKPKRHRKYLRIKTWQELSDSDGCSTWTRMALKTASRRPLQLTSLSLVMYEQHLSCTLHFNWDLLLTRFVEHGQRPLQREQWRSCLPWSTSRNHDPKIATIPVMNKTLMNRISKRNDSTKRFPLHTSVVSRQRKMHPPLSAGTVTGTIASLSIRQSVGCATIGINKKTIDGAANACRLFFIMAVRRFRTFCPQLSLGCSQ